MSDSDKQFVKRVERFREEPIFTQSDMDKVQLENNRLELFADDLDAAHMCLDDMGAPRTDDSGLNEYSIKGRIDKLMDKALEGQLSEIKKIISYMGIDIRFSGHWIEGFMMAKSEVIDLLDKLNAK